MIRTSTAITPWPSGSTSSGLISNSVISGCATARRPTRTIASTNAARSAGAAPRTPSSSRRRSQLGDHGARIFGRQRGQSEADIGQHLRINAAQAQHDQRPESGVALNADDHLLAGRDHLLHLDTGDPRGGMCGPCARHDGHKARPRRLSRPDPQDHPADIRLVKISGLASFNATGKPIACASAAASSAVVANPSGGVGMPYARSNALCG